MRNKYKVPDLKFKLLEFKDVKMLKEKQSGLGREGFLRQLIRLTDKL